MKALIVEDEPLNREALRLLLEGAGYAVSMAWTAAGAVRQPTKEQPDIVLLDINLGEEIASGIDVARMMGSDEDWRQTPVIVTSALSSEGIRSRARADAFEGLRAAMLPKPIEADVLLHQMGTMLKEAR